MFFFLRGLNFINGIILLNRNFIILIHIFIFFPYFIFIDFFIFILILTIISLRINFTLKFQNFSKKIFHFLHLIFIKISSFFFGIAYYCFINITQICTFSILRAFLRKVNQIQFNFSLISFKIIFFYIIKSF